MYQGVFLSVNSLRLSQSPHEASVDRCIPFYSSSGMAPGANLSSCGGIIGNSQLCTRDIDMRLEFEVARARTLRPFPSSPGPSRNQICILRCHSSCSFRIAATTRPQHPQRAATPCYTGEVSDEMNEMNVSIKRNGSESRLTSCPTCTHSSFRCLARQLFHCSSLPTLHRLRWTFRRRELLFLCYRLRHHLDPQAQCCK
jgi:hypothetical protein